MGICCVVDGGFGRVLIVILTGAVTRGGRTRRLVADARADWRRYHLIVVIIAHGHQTAVADGTALRKRLDAAEANLHPRPRLFARLTLAAKDGNGNFPLVNTD